MLFSRNLVFVQTYQNIKWNKSLRLLDWCAIHVRYLTLNVLQSSISTISILFYFVKAVNRIKDIIWQTSSHRSYIDQQSSSHHTTQSFIIRRILRHPPHKLHFTCTFISPAPRCTWSGRGDTNLIGHIFFFIDWLKFNGSSFNGVF